MGDKKKPLLRKLNKESSQDIQGNQDKKDKNNKNDKSTKAVAKSKKSSDSSGKAKKVSNDITKSKKSGLSNLKFLSRLAYNVVTKGQIEYIDNIPLNKIGIGSGSIFTHDGLRWYYVITKFPKEVEDSFLDDLRKRVTGLFNDSDVTVNFIIDASPYTYDPTSYKNANIVRQWKSRYDNTKAREASMSRTDKLFVDESVKEARERDDHMIQSYELFEKAQYEKRSLFKFTMIIELEVKFANVNKEKLPISHTKRDIVRLAQKSLYDASKRLTNSLNTDKIGHKRVYGFMLDFLKRYGAMSLKKHTLSTDLYPSLIVTDDILSRFMTYSQGVFNNVGQYLGNDKKSNAPIFYNFIQNNKAQNIIIAAKTGGGKSFFTKMLLFFFLIFKCRLVINDYEGDEYKMFGKYVGANVIDMKGANAVYVDTSVIGKVTGDEEIDASLYEEAVNTTQLIFSALFDVDEGMTSNQTAIFSRAYRMVYNKLGVNAEDKSTWHLSEGSSFKSIYEMAVSLKEDSEAVERYGNDLNVFINTLSVFFDDQYGIKTHMFKKRITVDDLKENRVNIFSFGNKGGSSQTISKTDTAIRQIYVAYISNLLANYNKTVLGSNTVLVFEEGQRYGEQRGSAEIISNTWTGARKRNAIGMLMTNSPNKLIEYGGMFRDILDNTTTLILGELESNTAKSLCDYYEIPFAEEYLKTIKTNVNYEYSFLLALDRKYYTVSSMIVPQSLAEHEIFKTKEDTKYANYGKTEAKS